MSIQTFNVLLKHYKENLTENTLQLSPPGLDFITYISNNDIGKIIGEKGIIITQIRIETGATISIDSNKSRSSKRKLRISGDNIEMARQRIMECF